MLSVRAGRTGGGGGGRGSSGDRGGGSLAGGGGLDRVGAAACAREFSAPARARDARSKSRMCEQQTEGGLLK